MMVAILRIVQMCCIVSRIEWMVRYISVGGGGKEAADPQVGQSVSLGQIFMRVT